MALKTIYLARRNPAIAEANFAKRWIQHSALAGGFPKFQRYFAGVVQCCAIHDATIVPESINDFDGVNLIAMRSEDATEATAFWDEPETIHTMIPDELRVFDRPVRQFSMLVEPDVLLKGATTGFGVITFIKRRDGSDAGEFVRRWGNSLLELPAFQHRVRRYVRNRMVLPPPPGYEFDLVSELWCDNLDEIAALHADDTYKSQLAADTAALCNEQSTVTMLIRVSFSKGAAS